MLFLGRFRILPKILSIVLLLAVLMGALSYLAITTLAEQNENAERMAVSAKRTLEAARARQRVVAMNQAELRAALDPAGEHGKTRKAIEEMLAQFRELMEAVGKTTDGKVQAMLPGVHQALSVYEQALNDTMSATDAAASQKITDTAAKLRDAVAKSRTAAEKLSSELKAVAERLDDRVQEYSQKTSDEYASKSKTLIVISIASVLAGTLFGVLIGQFGVARPIRSIVALLQQLATGNYDVEVHSTDRRDEVGEVAKTALAFKENGLAKFRMEAEQKEADTHAAAQRKADMVRLADSFESAVGQIVETVSSASTELEASAGTLTTSADHSQQLATTVAAASEQASANVQSVASATEELSSSVSEISRQVQESARMAGDAVSQARATTECVGELSKAAARISDVVELINTIASQTNLLALNATIEAARAGDAGRGFAVVASEVKALAEQTAKATDEISQQISGIQAATQDSVTSIKEISGTIEKLSEVSSTIAAAVEEQGAATQEISRNVQQAAQGTHQVSTNITDVQRGAAETGSASSQVLSAAQSLASDSNRLKLEVGRFLSSVRAA
ncbi:methyl-accepting chemotaxis protein [Bradyrhizobium sp. UFLA05-109]